MAVTAVTMTYKQLQFNGYYIEIYHLHNDELTNIPQATMYIYTCISELDMDSLSQTIFRSQYKTNHAI